MNNQNQEQFIEKLNLIAIELGVFIDFDEPNEDLIKHYNFSQSEIREYTNISNSKDYLNLIQNSTRNYPLENSIGFAADSLFCEWAYLIDLDNDKLEIYKGWNEKELKSDDGFYCFNNKNEKYKPIKLFKSYSFSSLSNNILNDLE